MQIAFGYPRRGLTGRFNTFRLGTSWVEKCPVGALVELVDARSKRVLKQATVLGHDTGTLTEMAFMHSKWAHNWLEYPEAQRSALLIASMRKRYPPGRVSEDSVCTVIYLGLKKMDCLFKPGDAVKVNDTAGFHKGAKGRVVGVEQHEGRTLVWVLRNGSSSAVYYSPSEIDMQKSEAAESAWMPIIEQDSVNGMYFVSVSRVRGGDLCVDKDFTLNDHDVSQAVMRGLYERQNSVQVVPAVKPGSQK